MLCGPGYAPSHTLMNYERLFFGLLNTANLCLADTRERAYYWLVLQMETCECATKLHINWSTHRLRMFWWPLHTKNVVAWNVRFCDWLTAKFTNPCITIVVDCKTNASMDYKCVSWKVRTCNCMTRRCTQNASNIAFTCFEHQHLLSGLKTVFPVTQHTQNAKTWVSVSWPGSFF